jgi:hypothetical protein
MILLQVRTVIEEPVLGDGACDMADTTAFYASTGKSIAPGYSSRHQSKKKTLTQCRCIHLLDPIAPRTHDDRLDVVEAVEA